MSTKGASSRHYIHETQSKAAHDPIPAIEEVGRYIEQAENRAKSVKDIARDLAKDRAVLANHQEQHLTAEGQPIQQQQLQTQQATAETQAAEQPPAGPEPVPINPETIPPPPQRSEQTQQETQPSKAMESSTHTLQTFNPQASTKAGVQLQEEHIQYVDNECCQVAVGVIPGQGGQQQVQQQVQAVPQADHVTSQQQQQMLQQQQQHQQQTAAAAAATLPRQRQPPNHPSAKSKTGTLNAQMTTASQFATLERNMAEVAQRNRESRAELTTNQANTLGRQSRYGDNSCDTCDAPLTPASLAGIDHRDLEHRPLTRSVTRATVYDEPPER